MTIRGGLNLSVLPAVIVAASALLSTDAQAGIVIPWKQSEPSLSTSAARRHCGTSGAASQAAAEYRNQTRHPKSDGRPEIALENSLANSPSGASAPTQGAAGGAWGDSQVASSELVIEPPEASAFRRRLESFPRLLNPPLLALLDPPRHGA